MVALHQSDKGAAWVEGPLEDGLQQAVGGDLYGDGISWDVLQGLLEEDGADQVVDVVLGRRVLGQLSAPPVRGDGRRHPAGCTGTPLTDHLQQLRGHSSNLFTYIS